MEWKHFHPCLQVTGAILAAFRIFLYIYKYVYPPNVYVQNWHVQVSFALSIMVNISALAANEFFPELKEKELSLWKNVYFVCTGILTFLDMYALFFPAFGVDNTVEIFLSADLRLQRHLDIFLLILHSCLWQNAWRLLESQDDIHFLV